MKSFEICKYKVSFYSHIGNFLLSYLRLTITLFPIPKLEVTKHPKIQEKVQENNMQDNEKIAFTNI